MGTNYVESSLKRFLKRKVKVTLGLVVAFMITGTVSFSAVEIGYKGDKITVNGKTEGDITEGRIEGNKWINDKEIKSEVVLNNEILTSGIALDIENNGTISADDSDNTGYGNGINIFNTAEDGKIGNIINNGIISGKLENKDEHVQNLGNGIGIYNYKDRNNKVKILSLNSFENEGIISGQSIVGQPEEDYLGRASLGNGIGIFNYTNYSESEEVDMKVLELGDIVNNGMILGKNSLDSSEEDYYFEIGNIGNGIGIYSFSHMFILNELGSINNNGIIFGETKPNIKTAEELMNVVNIGNGIGVYNYNIGKINLDGINNKGIIKGTVENNDVTAALTNGGNGIGLYSLNESYDNNILKINNDIINKGSIIGKFMGNLQEQSNAGNGLGIYNNNRRIIGIIALNNISNSGTIVGNIIGTAKDASIVGNGVSLYNFAKDERIGEITLNGIANTGLIIGSENGVYLHDVTMTENFNNYGVVGGKNAVVIEDKDGTKIEDKDINYGLYLIFDETDKNIVTEVKSGTGGKQEAIL